MPLMSPGGGLTWFSPVTVTTFLLLLTVNLCSGGPSDKTSETVVIQIANIKQPENCSLFLNSLEVRNQSFYYHIWRERAMDKIDILHVQS